MSNTIELTVLTTPDPAFPFVTDLSPGITIRVIPATEVDISVNGSLSFTGTSGYIATGAGSFTVEARKNGLLLDTKQVTISNQGKFVTLLSGAVTMTNQFVLQNNNAFPMQSLYLSQTETRLPSLQAARVTNRWNTRVLPLV